MLVQIQKVLTPEELAAIRGRLQSATWVDGRTTAGVQSVKVKANLQLAEQSPEARELGQAVARALERSALFMSATLPRQIYPPLFNRYEAGMNYGAHVDNAIRAVAGSPQRLRADVSATLFLSEPSEYDGGELIVEDTYGLHSVKLAAGDMIVYPASSLHRIQPVTRGARDAAFFWVQSLVKDDGARSLLFDLDRTFVELSQTVPDNPAIVRLTSVYHNLLRRWSEV
jgi:PKHD-type hydroxylase